MARYFWAGSNSNVHTCQCGIDDNCVDSLTKCNCDALAPVNLLDEGKIWNYFVDIDLFRAIVWRRCHHRQELVTRHSFKFRTNSVVVFIRCSHSGPIHLQRTDYSLRETVVVFRSVNGRAYAERILFRQRQNEPTTGNHLLQFQQNGIRIG